MASRRSSLTPQFGFNDKTGRYYWVAGPDKGKFVSRETTRIAIDDYIETKADAIRSLAVQLQNREINIAGWQRAMEKEIAKVHMSNMAAAKGGWDRMTPADYGRVGQLVKQELAGKAEWGGGGLRKFALDIENGLPLDGRFLNRAQQYAEAGRHTYHVAEALDMKERGYDEQRFIRHASDSCSQCIALALLGWHPIGTTPEPGERQCKRNCKCTKSYRKSSEA